MTITSRDYITTNRWTGERMSTFVARDQENGREIICWGVECGEHRSIRGAMDIESVTAAGGNVEQMARIAADKLGRGILFDQTH